MNMKVDQKANILDNKDFKVCTVCGDKISMDEIRACLNDKWYCLKHAILKKTSLMKRNRS